MRKILDEKRSVDFFKYFAILVQIAPKGNNFQYWLNLKFNDSTISVVNLNIWRPLVVGLQS